MPYVRRPSPMRAWCVRGAQLIGHKPATIHTASRAAIASNRLPRRASLNPLTPTVASRT